MQTVKLLDGTSILDVYEVTFKQASGEVVVFSHTANEPITIPVGTISQIL